MLTFFTSKPKVASIDFSNLRTDMHSHILPGIDDGAQNVSQSVTLVKKMMDLGFSKIIATPHIKQDYYPNTFETITTALNHLNETLANQGVNIEIQAAAEYYFDENFVSALEKDDLLTINNRYILFELSFFNFPLNLFEIINKIILKGYIPILAHPERYEYLGGSVENFYKIKESGCLLQMNTIALTGYYGKLPQKIAEELVSNNLIDYMGSDMHHIKHAEALKQSLFLPNVERLLNESQLKNAYL